MLAILVLLYCAVLAVMCCGRGMTSSDMQFHASANVQTRLLTSGDSIAQKVGLRFSEYGQGAGIKMPVFIGGCCYETLYCGLCLTGHLGPGHDHGQQERGLVQCVAHAAVTSPTCGLTSSRGTTASQQDLGQGREHRTGTAASGHKAPKQCSPGHWPDLYSVTKSTVHRVSLSGRQQSQKKNNDVVLFIFQLCYACEKFWTKDANENSQGGPG